MHRAVVSAAASSVKVAAPVGWRSHTPPYQPSCSADRATKPCRRYAYSVPAPSGVNHVRCRGTQARKQAARVSEQAKVARVVNGPAQAGAPRPAALSLWKNHA
ncbi:hypothetical protein DWC19_02040 [Streptomyces sp. M7]|nr:hypothetical protein DWC19_02040 [Streptomyces sp. M7]